MSTTLSLLFKQRFFIVAISALALSGCSTDTGALLNNAIDVENRQETVVQFVSKPPVQNLKIRDYGFVLANMAGKPLYTFDNDTENTSVCYEECAALWPPELVAADLNVAQPYSVIARTDGTHQLALDGKPLYTYAKDGFSEATGEAVAGWHLVVLEQ